MSQVIFGLVLCLLLNCGPVRANGLVSDKNSPTRYCLSFRGKCLPRCDSKTEIEIEKLQTSCSGELRCCIGRRPSRPQESQRDLLVQGGTHTTSLVPPAIGLWATAKNLSSSSPSLQPPETQPTWKVVRSTPSVVLGFPMTFQNTDTKVDTSFINYNRLRKTGVEGCGVPVLDRVRRIVGGTQARRCLYPWMVRISRDPLRDDLCGGTLVSNKYIVTAAHCFDYLGNNWPVLHIGEYNRQDGGSNAKFITSSYTVIVHPDYSRFTFSYDIAILKLHVPIPLDSYECLRPICLPDDSHAVKVGDSCSVAGWGSTSKDPNTRAVSSPYLMTTQITVVNDSFCQNKFGILYNDRSQICAGDLTGRTDSCVGDSGGPLMCLMTNSKGESSEKMPVQFLMGVISSGATPCAQAGTPALYTDMKAVREWVRSLTKL